MKAENTKERKREEKERKREDLDWFFCFLGEHFSGAALEIQRSNQPGAQDRGLSQQKQPICEKITGILGANQEIKCSTGAPHWGIRGLIAAGLGQNPGGFF